MVTKRVLGRTGFQVTAISFGAWQIVGLGYGQVSAKDAQATIAAYLEKGGNFIDTARRYGESECILGDFFQQNGALNFRSLTVNFAHEHASNL
jgi:aryl-alcohol dehydrogenase-like predicted oxidoreductase